MKNETALEKLRSFLEKGIFGFSYESICFMAIFIFRVVWNYFITLFIEENNRQVRFYDRVSIAINVVFFVLLVLRLILWLTDRNRKKPELCTILITAYAGLAALSSLLNYGFRALFERNMFVNLLEVAMVTLFMFHTARTLKEEKVHHVLSICGMAVFVIVAVLETASLIMYFSPEDASINIFGTVYTRQDMFEPALPGHLLPYYFGGIGKVFGSVTFHAALASMLGFYLMDRKILPSWLAMLHYVMTLVLIILGNARMPLINTIVTGLFAVVYFLRKANKDVKKILKIWAGIAGAAVLAVIILKWNRVSMILSMFLSDPAETLNILTSGRFVHFIESAQLANQSPLYGKGWICQIGNLRNAHNIFANALAYTGYTGLVLLAAFFVSAFRLAAKNRERISQNLFLLCIVVCVFIHANLDKAILGETGNAETYLFWYILGYFCFGPMNSLLSSRMPDMTEAGK